MAWAFTVDVVDPVDGEIKVSHTFWGETKEECRTYYEEHRKSCEYFDAAVLDGRTLEDMEEISDEELPTADEEEDEDEEEAT
jgi:hypothetical protein